MAKSQFADRFAQGKVLLDQIYDEHLGRLERQGSIKDRKALLQDWAQLAGAENAVRERYLGRYLFELIQNANDAIYDGKSTIQHSRRGVRIELTDDALWVANDGLPFGEQGVRALCQLYRSTKPASKCIGHKGIGFKSVLEVSDTPEVYSDIYAFSFQWDAFHRRAAEIMGETYLDGIELPAIKVPFMLHLKQQPVGVRTRIDTLLESGYATIVRLPFPIDKAEQFREQVRQDIQAQIRPDLLLFLPEVASIDVAYPDGATMSLRREVFDTPHPGMQEVIVTQSNTDGGNARYRWLVLGPVQRDIPNRGMVEALNSRAWLEVEALRFTIAIPLHPDTEELLLTTTSQPFHVYFPTKEQSGLSFLVHADFYVGDDRKSLPNNQLNSWLTEEICAYIAGDGVELLKKYWPSGPELVRILAPVIVPQQEFPAAFMQLYHQYLELSSFVPSSGGHYRKPPETRLPPKEVEQRRFRRLFAPNALRGSERWDYPTEDVVNEEYQRPAPFLLALGSRVIDLETIIPALREAGMPNPEDAGDLLGFLADWWDTLPLYPQNQRAAFIQQLQDLQIFPTHAGWKRSGEGAVFQANLRSGAQDISAPPGFEFSVIVRSVYPDTGTRSTVYRLFGELHATEYSARSLVRDSILPALTDPERFEQLLQTHPGSIWDAYALLKCYAEDDGSTGDFKKRLGQVPVPAARVGDHQIRVWRPAQETYFGSPWPHGEALETIFGPFEDAYFLPDIPDLHIEEDTERDSWYRFFRWLGVHAFPRFKAFSGPIRYNAKSPLPEASLWSEYMDAIGEGFRCRHPTKGQWHGYSRELGAVHILEHFDDLVATGDAERLSTLYQLLATGWQEVYRPHCYTRLTCDYVSTGCPSDGVEDYLLYALRHAAWLPAEIAGKVTACLAPKHIWMLGETDPAAARQLVPTLPTALRMGMYKDLANDLAFTSSSVAEIEDYVELLRLFPQRYPTELSDVSTEELQQWQRSLSTAFNWICERIHVGLGSRGDNRPLCPDDLYVLAMRDGRLCYEPLTTPDLVYPDNALMKQRWSPHCAYLLGNDDWQRLREWLGVPELSKVVDVRHEFGSVVMEATRQFRGLFDHTLPYYLALIRTAQESRYDIILARIRRLHVHVVDRLVVEETLTTKPDEVLQTEVQVYLEKTQEPNPRGGPAIRAGNLYVTPAVLENLDLLGDYIADYVEIARLGDAFVLLVNRADDVSRWRFLVSKGIDSATFSKVQLDLSASSDEQDIHTSGAEIIDQMIEQAAEQARHDNHNRTNADTQDQETPEGETEDNQDEGLDRELRKSYPALDPTAVPSWVFAPPDLPQGNITSRRSGVGGGGIFMGDSESNEEIGRRGEEWVYRMERHRLKREYGLDPNAMEKSGQLVWLSRIQPSANHDIRSIWKTPAGEVRTLFIEVKATSSRERRVILSRSEFELALTHGSDYWLCFVGNAGDSIPDDPICYRDLARYIQERQVVLALNKVTMTLPQFGLEDDHGT